MPYIHQFSDEEATGPVRQELDAARNARGAASGTSCAIMTPNAAVLRASMQMYRAVMYGDSPLSRHQREMLAVVVSKANHCVY
jgi:alkylhydroperoxidase family enzyme